MESKVASGMTLTLITMSILTLAFNIPPLEASENTGKEGQTIYIRADGSIYPLTAPVPSVDNVTYTLTDKLYEMIVVERDNIVVDGAGYTLQGKGSGTGIDLTGRFNVTIKGTEIEAFDSGILLENSYSNSIHGNNITNNKCGINLIGSLRNSICENNITNNMYGIILAGSSSNSIHGNNITNNKCGLYLDKPCPCPALKYLGPSNYNTIIGNNITNNERGIRVNESSNNIIHHNNFVDNTEQVPSTDSTNAWDDGYPSGGNYWSDYTGADLFSGPHQNATGSDGIGDASYVINEGNGDPYPFMNPFVDTTKPTADAGQDQTTNVGETITFDASGSTDNVGIFSYEWDFGDGTTGKGKTATHAYENPRTYTVRLTVKDAAGNTGADSTTIKVLGFTTFPWLIAGAAAISVAVVAMLSWKKLK